MEPIALLAVLAYLVSGTPAPWEKSRPWTWLVLVVVCAVLAYRAWA